MSLPMRAKLRISQVNHYEGNDELFFKGVSAKNYNPDGLDEDNTYAKFSPTADFHLILANPALMGHYKVGDIFYVDFTPIQETQEDAAKAA